MKIIRFNRRRILGAIRAACVALFLAAAAGRAGATPVYTQPYYTLSGSTVTGSGTSSAAYFNDTGTAGYTVNVGSGANLSDAPNAEIEIDHGTVNNQGTVTYTGSNNYLGGVVIETAGVVNNSGTISAPNGTSYSVQFFGTSGTINNSSTGIITSVSGNYFAGTASVVNNGLITATGATGIAIGSDGIGTIQNTGTITGSLYGVQLNFHQTAGSSTVTNSGTITASAANDDAVIILGDGQVTNNGGTISDNGTNSNGVRITGAGQVTNSNGGTISGVYNGVFLLGGGTVSNSARSMISGSGAGVYIDGNGAVTNAGSITSVNGTSEAQGVGFTGMGTVSNSGSIYVSNPTLVQGILIEQSGQVTNSGSIGANGSTSYGVLINEAGTVTNTATGDIRARGANAMGISIGGMGQVYNSGSIYGADDGVYLGGNRSLVLTTGGSIGSDGRDAINLAGMDSTATIRGRAETEGTIEGTAPADGNVLNFQLTGLTTSQAVGFKRYVDTHQNSGSYTFYRNGQGQTYEWANFADVTDTSTSMQLVVDPGLADLAARLDAVTLPAVYDVLYGGNSENVLNQFSGREFYDAFATMNLGITTAFGELADSRDFDLRHGTGGFDFSQLHVVPGSMIASLGQTEGSLVQMLGMDRLAGTTMSDSKDMKTMEPSAEAPRWGAWASGTVSVADESTTYTSPGYQATTGSPTIGADYRLCPELAVGTLFNYDTTGANFGDGSRLGEQTELLGLYATAARAHWFANSLVAFGYESYDLQRTALTGATASSHPQGDEVLADLTTGYEFRVANWAVDPEVGFQYTHLAQDGYGESGAGAFNLNVADQEVDSFRTKVGFRAMGDYTWDGVRFSPDVHAAWYHECMDDQRGISIGVPGAPALGSFVVQTEQPQRDFALVGAGLSATPVAMHLPVTFFVNYDAQVGQSDYIAHTFNGGVRIGF